MPFTITCPAAGSNNGSYAISRSGYTPLGLIGYSLSGSMSSWLNIQRLTVTSSTIDWMVRNPHASTASTGTKLAVYVLWQKN